MPDIKSIAAQVKHNCNISDAKHWGYYSPCGLLLRLRDLYRIEKDFKPWQSIDHKDIGEWICRKEKSWEELEDNEYQPVEIGGKCHNPFDLKAINSVLMEHGYIYGAGYGDFLKPLFILAKLSEQSVKGRYSIYCLGKELARDLSASPAMIRGNIILARTETTAHFLWGKFEEMKAQKCNGALSRAFAEYGISKDADRKFSPDRLKNVFSKVTREELATYVYHELGEASQRTILGTWWKSLLLKIPYSRAELFLRGLKDVLSDTCNSGMLAHIIKNKKTGSLGFYIALLSGVRRNIFPGILPAYGEFTKAQNWGFIEEARIEGYKRAGDYVRNLKEMFDRGNVSPEAIEQEFMPSTACRLAPNGGRRLN